MPYKDQWTGHYEFGGPVGCIVIILFSHAIMYYLWACITLNNGDLIIPNNKGHVITPLGSRPFLSFLWKGIVRHALPTWKTVGLLLAFNILQVALAKVLPGPIAYGLPVPSENGHRMTYKCNAVYAWYLLLLGYAVMDYSGVLPLTTLVDSLGSFMSSAVILADIASIIVFLRGRSRAVRLSGNIVYDFFMGSELNPRFPGGVDMKLFFEIRNSWMLLFLITTSCAARMYQSHQTLTPNMVLLLVAHFLYANACQKGEQCIPSTFDIHYEKFGWMLLFWNAAGVPFLYSFQGYYLVKVVGAKAMPTSVFFALLVLLLAAYYVFDTANSQKNRFRMQRNGADRALVRRRTFPHLPWAYIEDPKTIRDDKGHELFVDGWYQYGRKIHYTADTIMAFIWGASCYSLSFVPFFYVTFFTLMISHRERRDAERCRAKYGELWKQYIARVPYRFIPGVY